MTTELIIQLNEIGCRVLVEAGKKNPDIQIGPPEFLTSFYNLDLLDNSAGSLLCRANGIVSCIRQVVTHICQF